MVYIWVLSSVYLGTISKQAEVIAYTTIMPKYTGLRPIISLSANSSTLENNYARLKYVVKLAISEAYAPINYA